MVFYLQTTLIAFLSFVMFRNLDKPAVETGIFIFKWELLWQPFFFSLLFSFITLSPLPSCLFEPLKTKHVLGSLPDDLDGAEFTTGIDSMSSLQDGDDGVPANEESSKLLEDISVDPNIPL